MGYRRIADRLRFAGGLRQQRPLLQVKPSSNRPPRVSNRSTISSDDIPRWRITGYTPSPAAQPRSSGRLLRGARRQRHAQLRREARVT